MLSVTSKRNLCDITKTICKNLLNIAVPELVFQRNEQMTTKTTMMLTEKTDRGYKVYIDPTIDFTPPIICFLSHELRHIYQFENNPEILFDYQQSFQMTTEDYNLQPAEIDANAFGMIAQIEMTRTKPLWPFPENVIEAIENRKKEILRDEFHRK